MAERDSAVLTDLQEIDTTVTDQLLEMREQRQELETRLSRLTEAEGQVSGVVYQRVREDYEEQQKVLEERAAPLVDQAQTEFQKLIDLLKQAEEVARTAQFDEEELQVRHRVGEFDEEEYKSRVVEVRARLEGHQRDLEAVAKVKERFVAALDWRDELADALPPTNNEDAPRPAEKPSPELPEGAPPISKTVMGPLPAAVELSGAGEPPPTAPGEPPAPSVVPAGTQLLPIARLIPLRDDSDEVATEAREYPVLPITTVGRSADNQVQIDETAVSRFHAQIVLEPGGFVLRDLDSQNGTYVNGDPVKEHLLAEGDRIQIGTIRFVFRPA